MALIPVSVCAQMISIFAAAASRAESLSAGGSYLPGATGALGTAEPPRLAFEMGWAGA